MTADELIRQIGHEGDALFRPTLNRKDRAGNTVPFTPPAFNPESMLTARVLDAIAEAGSFGAWIGLASLMLLAPFVDFARLLLQGTYFPLAWLIWRSERMLSRWQRRSFFCPLCTNSIEDPLVYCPHCLQIQPRIQPTWTAPLLWRCDCDKSTWPTLGQYLLKCPQPLVCRDLPHVTGCLHFHPLRDLAGKYPATHAALVGTSFRTKHAVMAHLFAHMADGFGKKRNQSVPASRISVLELQLARTHLFAGFMNDTSECEAPGERYTLGLCFSMLAKHRKKLYAVHNVAQPWLVKTDVLNRKSLNWKLIRNLVVVLDPKLLGKIDSPQPVPQAETVSRLIRVIEQYCDVQPGTELPHRLAIVLPVPPRHFFADLQKELGGLPPTGAVEGQVQRVVRERDPALYALVRCCFKPSHVRFFSGPLPDTLDLPRTAWLTNVLDWLY